MQTKPEPNLNMLLTESLLAEVISAQPGARTEKFSSDNLTRFLKLLFTHWERNGCAPSLLSTGGLMVSQGNMDCEMNDQKFSDTISALAHAIKEFMGQFSSVDMLKNCEPEPSKLSCLSSREAEIMELVRNGKTNIEIGMILDISEFTVKNHLQRIFKKLDVTSRTQAVAKFHSSYH